MTEDLKVGQTQHDFQDSTIKLCILGMINFETFIFGGKFKMSLRWQVV